MNKRLVRIYKNPEGKGDYVNKTKAFLKKAQMGEEVQSTPDVNQYMQHIYKQLSNDVTLDDVFAELVATGIKEDAAYQLLSTVVSKMVESGELNPDNPITKSEQAEAIKAEEEAAKQKQQEQQPQEEAQQEEEPDQATDYFNSYADEPEYSQPDLEFQDGGESEDEEDTSMQTQETTNQEQVQEEEQDGEDVVDNNQYGFLKQSAQYPGLEDYYQGFTPLEWDAQNVTDFSSTFYKKGGSKKSFVKNVLKRLQEGGQENKEEQSNSIGQGNKFDTFTEDVSKIKQNFIETLKNKANKAKLDETYDKMMNSGKQDLIETAYTMSQNRNQSEEEEGGSFFQSGGYIGGENAPEMFMYGGSEMPFYEADFLPEAQDGKEVRKAKIKYVPNKVLPANTTFKVFNPAFGEKRTVTGNPYNALTREIYRDPVDKLTPVARTVHKRGIFGRPKKWTDYYSTGPSGIDQDFINNFSEYKPKADTKKTEDKKTKDEKDNDINKWGYTEKEWDEFSGKEKRLERRGQRRLRRQMDRGEEKDAKDKAFMSTPNLIQQFDGYTEQINDANGNRLKVPKLLEVTKKLEPELSFEERMGMNDPEFYKTESKERPLEDNWSEEDEAILDERRAEADAIYQQALKEREEEVQKEKAAEAERRLQASRFYANYPEGNTDRRLGLGDAADPDAEYQAKARDKAYNQFAQLRDFVPNKKAFEAYEIKRKEMEALQRDEEARLQLENDMQSYEDEKQLGGFFKKYQIAGAVKSPTNNLSTASDPTANSGNLINMLKPQDNPNTLLGASTPFMNQNVPAVPGIDKVETVTMDPNQTKDQKITSLDFGNPDKDRIIAQDFETKRDFDGEAFNTKLNKKIDRFTGIMKGMEANKQQDEMYKNNFTSDNIYGLSEDKDRGDYVAYGQQTGMFRPDQTGQETMGRFAYGQSGGYMEDDDYTEGDEVDMTEEELAEFLANGGEVEYL
jgi:hypothetical protein